jgi:hypothetical protein
MPFAIVKEQELAILNVGNILNAQDFSFYGKSRHHGIDSQVGELIAFGQRLNGQRIFKWGGEGIVDTSEPNIVRPYIPAILEQYPNFGGFAGSKANLSFFQRQVWAFFGSGDMRGLATVVRRQVARGNPHRSYPVGVIHEAVFKGVLVSGVVFVFPFPVVEKQVLSASESSEHFRGQTLYALPYDRHSRAYAQVRARLRLWLLIVNEWPLKALSGYGEVVSNSNISGGDFSTVFQYQRSGFMLPRFKQFYDSLLNGKFGALFVFRFGQIMVSGYEGNHHNDGTDQTKNREKHPPLAAGLLAGIEKESTDRERNPNPSHDLVNRIEQKGDYFTSRHFAILFSAAVVFILGVLCSFLFLAYHGFARQWTLARQLTFLDNAFLARYGRFAFEQ